MVEALLSLFCVRVPNKGSASTRPRLLIYNLTTIYNSDFFLLESTKAQNSLEDSQKMRTVRLALQTTQVRSVVLQNEHSDTTKTSGHSSLINAFSPL